MNTKKHVNITFWKIHEYVNKVDENIFDTNFTTNDQPKLLSVNHKKSFYKKVILKISRNSKENIFLEFLFNKDAGP